jgi:RHS repeat-associated protein
VESVQALAKQFGDFAHDVESAYQSLNSFGGDAAALQWVGQTADAFKSNFGPLPGRLQKLYTSYSEASDALSAYWPKLQAAQSKADSALRQAQDAHVDLQRAGTAVDTAASDLKTAQQNQATNPTSPQAVTDAQTAHDTAQTNLNNAKARMAALTTQANQAHDDRIAAAKICASAIGKAQGDGIHNKSWWDHVGADLAEWGGEIGKIAGELAPILDIIALATSWIPGLDVITAALAEIDNIVALAGTAMATIGDAMQGKWGDALLGAGMLALTFVGARALGSEAEAVEGEAGAVEGAEGAAEGGENAVGADARTAEGGQPADTHGDPVDVVSGWMLTEATDVELSGVLPLVIRRAYASGYSAGRLHGPGWSSTLDQRLSVNAAGIHFAGDDAQRLDYPLPDPEREVLPQRGARWPLTWDRDTDEIRIADPWTGHTRHFTVVHFQNETGQIRDLTAITDRNGNRIGIVRDEQGIPVVIEHPGYRVAVDTVVSATGPRISALRLLGGEAGAETVLKRFRYDERGRLTQVLNSSGLPFTYEWGADDRVSAWQDYSGYRYEYFYDHLGRVTRGEGGFLAATFHYDPANRTTVITNSLGHATTVVYDEYGHVTSETDALGNTVRTETDPYGRVLSRTDALGNTSGYERDDAGNARRVVAADGAVTEFAYNDLHQVTGVIAADGAQWGREYDSRGNLLTVTDPAGAVTRFATADTGALAMTTDPLGVVTRFENDGAGLPTTILSPIGGVIRIGRDHCGRVARLTDALGAVTTYEWNPEGLPVSRTGPDGATTRWRHDAGGRLTEIVDPLGAATRYEPGPMGTLVAQTGPDGVRHTFAYDSELNLLAVTNPAGATWTYAYDPVGRLVAETDFVGRELGYEYDLAGRLAVRTAGTGDRISLSRDAAGRVTKRRTPEGEYAYFYDAAGRLARATGPDTAVGYERDVLGRVVAETVDDRVMRYTYNLAGKITGRTTASGVESAWTFDEAGRAVALTAGSGRLEFAFDTAGQEVRRLIGDGARLTRDYDAAGRLVGQHLNADAAGEAVLSRSWIWRADGVPEEIRDSLRGTRRVSFDTAGRPTAVTAEGWSESYAYDAFGNLADAGQQAVTTKTLIRQSGRTSYEYDASGRLARTVRRTLDGRRKTWTYTWDSQDRLVQADTPEHGSWRYTYDPFGRRTGKRRIGDDGSGSAQTLFTWDGPRLAEESTLGPDGTVTTVTWDYDPGAGFRPAAQRRRVWAAGGDAPAPAPTHAEQATVDESFHAIITDLLGTPTELVTPDGRVAWHTTTSIWGRTVASSADPDVDCPLRFPGQYHDTETGLHYNLYRYYDPETAAYLTPDPLGLAPAPNDHAYVPNPLTVSDPLGLSYEDNIFGTPPGGSNVPLKSLHPDSSLDKSSLDYWHTQRTDDIVDSLRPGQREPLIAKSDGTIMNGNTRVSVLRSRGYDVDQLPRESYGGSAPMSDEDFWDMDQ